MKYAKLLNELHALEGATLVSFHSRGDVEAVASAIALSKLLKNAVVKSPDKTNAAARHLLIALNTTAIPMLKQWELKQYENVVLVDVANKDMLAEFGTQLSKFKGKVIAIDHHEHGKLLKNAAVFEFPHRTSCCEIIYDLYRISGKKMDPLTATLLLAGIIADTARFKTANKETFHAVSQLLMASGKKYEEVLQLLKTLVDLSEVKSVLNALRTVELIETRAGFIGVVVANAFESKIAAVLVDAGCSVGICVNGKSGKIAMLKDSEDPRVKNIDVGKLMKETGIRMKGSGGGHEGIGGATGKPALTEKALAKLLGKLKKQLGA